MASPLQGTAPKTSLPTGNIVSGPVGNMAAGLVHEINNPLTYIVANLEMMEELRRPDKSSIDFAELQSMIREAREGTDRVQQIVRSLQEVALRPARSSKPFGASRRLPPAIAPARGLGASSWSTTNRWSSGGRPGCSTATA